MLPAAHLPTRMQLFGHFQWRHTKTLQRGKQSLQVLHMLGLAPGGIASRRPAVLVQEDIPVVAAKRLGGQPLVGGIQGCQLFVAEQGVHVGNLGHIDVIEAATKTAGLGFSRNQRNEFFLCFGAMHVGRHPFIVMHDRCKMDPATYGMMYRKGNSMKIILMGPPGSGKGTQAKLLCEHYGIVHISTGDLLRAAMQEDTPQGRELKELMGTGNLIADSVVLDLLKKRLDQDDCKTGYLLDGFPRNLDQAFAMASLGIAAESVVNMNVPFDAIVERMAGRRFHMASGRSYHVSLNPPAQEGLDDVTGEPLIQRKDDHPDIVQHRLNVYMEQTYPLMGYYMDQAKQGQLGYAVVDGLGDVKDVFGRIAAVLDATHKPTDASADYTP